MRTWSLCGLVLMFLAPGASQAQSDEVAKLRKEVEALCADVKVLRSELAKLQGETNKQKLIGVWHWRQEMGIWCHPPRSCAATYEFTKDGKIKSSDKMEGTYELAGETLKVKLGGKTVTWTIVRLDAAALTIEVGKMPVWDGDDAWRMRSFEKK